MRYHTVLTCQDTMACVHTEKLTVFFVANHHAFFAVCFDVFDLYGGGIEANIDRLVCYVQFGIIKLIKYDCLHLAKSCPMLRIGNYRRYHFFDEQPCNGGIAIWKMENVRLIYTLFVIFWQA